MLVTEGVVFFTVGVQPDEAVGRGGKEGPGQGGGGGALMMKGSGRHMVAMAKDGSGRAGEGRVFHPVRRVSS